jgi:hypothetical protein
MFDLGTVGMSGMATFRGLPCPAPEPLDVGPVGALGMEGAAVPPEFEEVSSEDADGRSGGAEKAPENPDHSVRVSRKQDNESYHSSIIR